MKLKYNNIELTILDNLVIENSISNVQISDIKVDFKGYTKDDLPLKFQEITITDCNDIPIYYGYLDKVDLPNYDGKLNLEHLTFSLLSPRAFYTKKIRSIEVENQPLNLAIASVFNLISNEGIVIEFNNLDTSKLVSFKFKAESLEKILTILGNEYSFYWRLDLDKKVYINDINKIDVDEPSLNVNTCEDLPFLHKLTPRLETGEYFNILKIKNVKVYNLKINMIKQNTPLINGESYKFENPINISINAGRQIYSQLSVISMFSLDTQAEDSYVRYVKATDSLDITSNVGILGVDDDNFSKTILLEVDPFLKTTVYGFKYRGADTTVNSCFSETVLIDTLFTYSDYDEIEKSKGLISLSGEVEKVVDFNDRYFSREQLLDFAKTQVRLNSNQTSDVEIELKGSAFEDLDNIYKNIPVGSIIRFNLPELFTVGNFLLKDSSLIKTGTTTPVIVWSLQNADVLNNFADLFRTVLTEFGTFEVQSEIKSVVFKERINLMDTTSIGGIQKNEFRE